VRWKEATGIFGEYAIAALAGYLLGSIPVALMVGRAHGVDLRQVGDGNPGAWNALEHLGARRAAPVFLGDAAKALAAGLAGLAIGGYWAAFAAVAGAMAGHAFPVFASFRGGKAVMCFVGGAFALAPVAALIALGLCVAVTLATHAFKSRRPTTQSFGWGARAGIFAYPAIQLTVDPVEHVAATGALMTFIGALFLLARLRRSGPATSASAAGSTT
jgi:acyl phosphate:glycerol-3-phosphate acyltransferase